MEDSLGSVRKSASLSRKLVSTLIAITLLGGGFYWYQLRPISIRRDCALDAGQRAFVTESATSEEKGLEKIRIANESFETYYLLCVRSKGLAE